VAGTGVMTLARAPTADELTASAAVASVVLTAHHGCASRRWPPAGVECVGQPTVDGGPAAHPPVTRVAGGPTGTQPGSATRFAGRRDRSASMGTPVAGCQLKSVVHASDLQNTGLLLV